MHYLNTTCLPGHHYNGFMATGALGHTHVWSTLYIHIIRLPNQLILREEISAYY